MNRLSEYIKNSSSARDSLKEARIQFEDASFTFPQIRTIKLLMDALDSHMRATHNAVSIREKKKPVVRS